MESEDWIEARKRKVADEFEVAEPRTKSAAQRLKDMAREKIKKGKNKLLHKKESTEDQDKKNEKSTNLQLLPDLIDTDPDSDGYEFKSHAGWKKVKPAVDLDGEWDTRKKRKRRKKKVSSFIHIHVLLCVYLHNSPKGPILALSSCIISLGSHEITCYMY